MRPQKRGQVLRAVRQKGMTKGTRVGRGSLFLHWNAQMLGDLANELPVGAVALEWGGYTGANPRRVCRFSFLKFSNSKFLSYSGPWKKKKKARKMARSVLKLQLLVGLGLQTVL